MEFFQKYTANRHIPIILLVNKSDLPPEKKAIDPRDLTRFSEQHCIASIEISAKFYKSIEQGITKLLELFSGDILKSGTLVGYRRPSIYKSIKIDEKPKSNTRRSSSQEKSAKKKGGCC